MADPTSTVLAHMRVPGEPAVYVLGSFERRVTLYSQQVRALNLVHALTNGGHLTPGQHVAVIGGGVAGLTAAAALLHLGLNVTLLEKQADLLPLIIAVCIFGAAATVVPIPRQSSRSADACSTRRFASFIAVVMQLASNDARASCPNGQVSASPARPCCASG